VSSASSLPLVLGNLEKFRSSSLFLLQPATQGVVVVGGVWMWVTGAANQPLSQSTNQPTSKAHPPEEVQVGKVPGGEVVLLEDGAKHAGQVPQQPLLLW
jgi:hypothetical protein